MPDTSPLDTPLENTAIQATVAPDTNILPKSELYTATQTNQYPVTPLVPTPVVAKKSTYWIKLLLSIALLYGVEKILKEIQAVKNEPVQPIAKKGTKNSGD